MIMTMKMRKKYNIDLPLDDALLFSLSLSLSLSLARFMFYFKASEPPGPPPSSRPLGKPEAAALVAAQAIVLRDKYARSWIGGSLPAKIAALEQLNDALNNSVANVLVEDGLTVIAMPAELVATLEQAFNAKLFARFRNTDLGGQSAQVAMFNLQAAGMSWSP